MNAFDDSALRQFYISGQTRKLRFRMRQLERLEHGLRTHYGKLIDALHGDLGKSETEAYASELAIVFHELEFTKKNLSRWMKPGIVPTPLHLQPARSEIHREPLGVVLIIGPWNYPVQLLLTPLIGAIAAGNCAVVKPSDLTPRTSAVIKTLLNSTFPTDYVSVIEADAAGTRDLLNTRFDHIFFTGSGRVGKIVYEAAARHLTPVTLELGGKSPVFVEPDADLELAAKRIVWGKFLNAGQTCVAPDYLYVHQTVHAPLLSLMKQVLNKHYGPNPSVSANFGRIVNDANFARLERLLAPHRLFWGGQRDRKDLFFAPTLISDVSWIDPIMQEEIFGPLLPILTYSSLHEACAEVERREKPLSAYLFAEDKQALQRFLALPFGGGCINDTVVHVSNPHLPFGGVGPSGFGNYHGRRSFLTYSHEKSILRKSPHLDVPLRYPPYSTRKLSWMRKLFKLSEFLD